MRAYAPSQGSLEDLFKGCAILPLHPAIAGSFGWVILPVGGQVQKDETERHRKVWKAWRVRAEVKR